MSPRLASLICFLCIFYLFWVDREKNEGVSRAVWIPLLWMFFAGSRFASQWLNLAPPEISAEGYSEGSPLDRNVFLGLILAGIWVLRQRRVNWSELLARNIWIGLFFLFAAISILWADDLVLSLKRWIKGLGNLVMALIIVTERRPDEALGLVLRRLAFFLLPLSVLFIKYYPELGRGYHMGMPLFSGATYGKNALGQLCLILGIYFFWELLLRHGKPIPSVKRLHYSIYFIILPMQTWLLYTADSATSLSCMIIAACLILSFRLSIMARKPNRIFSFWILCTIFFVILENLFNIKETIILMLGRRPDLTDRDIIWKLVLSMQHNPMIGAGYESFWTGERLTLIWEQLGVSGIIQAHNGYIELYLNLGIIGLTLLILSVFYGLTKTRKYLGKEYAYEALKIILIVVTLIYNYTEAMFIPVSNLFVLLLISILDVHNQTSSTIQQQLK